MSNEKSEIAIVGAGTGGTALIEFFFYEPRIKITGVIDMNEKSKGMQLAKSMGIKTYTSIEAFFKNTKTTPDFILNLTGDKKADKTLQALRQKKTNIVSGHMTKFFWDLIDNKRKMLRLEEKYNALQKEMKNNFDTGDVIFGNDSKMYQIQKMVGMVSPTPSTVLLTGETGTGKEMIANSIYANSKLSDKIFLKINCTAISSELLESELFGHKKGAFTGAVHDKQGLFERADGGTVFLDEIGDISIQMQVKLLRFLQFGEIRPVGSTEVKEVKVRIIAATNRNLEELIKREKFRSDLFYRINTITIDIPPLRLRKGDIPVYAYHFLKKNVKKINKTVTSISSEALEYLYDYDWPGNLRELDSVIERAVILTPSDQIELEHILPVSSEEEKTIDYRKGLMAVRNEMMSGIERKAISYYLNESKGNVSRAALLAQLPRRTFYRLIEKYEVDKNTFKNVQ